MSDILKKLDEIANKEHNVFCRNLLIWMHDVENKLEYLETMIRSQNGINQILLTNNDVLAKMAFSSKPPNYTDFVAAYNHIKNKESENEQ